MRDDSTALPMYNRARLVTALLLVILTSAAILLPLYDRSVLDLLAANLFYRQDLALVFLFLLAAALWPDRVSAPSAGRIRLTNLSLVLLALAVVLVAWAGHYLVFQGAHFSRDEQMAVFDQEIFARGHLLWPIPADWQPLADALNRRFILPIGDSEFWVSAYLPVHAAFRALVGAVADPALSSPLLAGLSVVCTGIVARKLWPDSHSSVLLALLLLVTSSQFLVTAMTAFSMTMHLALNLLWLALFLQGRWRSHVFAVVVGLFATGIHQPLFHPLFVLPFLWLLVQRREWRVLALYLAAYTAIGLFWLGWPQWISAYGSAPPEAIRCTDAVCTSGIGFVERLLATVTSLTLQNVWLTAVNLVRFVCWQHPLLLPLTVFGAISCWRADPLVRALAISLLLPVFVMALILPWQGHGWGYRYLHPVLGNAVLLACFGFHRFHGAGLSLRWPLAVTSVLAVGLIPLHGWMAAQMVAPAAEAKKELAEISADIVIVDTDNIPFAEDLVINRHDLSNTPKLLIGTLLKPTDMSSLCRRSTVAFYEGPKLAALAQSFGTPVPTAPSPHVQQLRAAAGQAKCRIFEIR